MMYFWWSCCNWWPTRAGRLVRLGIAIVPGGWWETCLAPATPVPRHAPSCHDWSQPVEPASEALLKPWQQGLSRRAMASHGCSIAFAQKTRSLFLLVRPFTYILFRLEYCHSVFAYHNRLSYLLPPALCSSPLTPQRHQSRHQSSHALSSLVTATFKPQTRQRSSTGTFSTLCWPNQQILLRLSL